MGYIETYRPGLKAELLKSFELLTTSCEFNHYTGEVANVHNVTSVRAVLDQLEDEKHSLRNGKGITIILHFENEDDAKRFVQDVNDLEKNSGRNEFCFLEAYKMKIKNSIFIKDMSPQVEITTDRNMDWLDFVGRNRAFGQVPKNYRPEETPLSAFLKEKYGVEYFSMSLTPAPIQNNYELKACPA